MSELAGIFGQLLGQAFLIVAYVIAGAMLALYGVGLLAWAIRLYYQEPEPVEG